MWLREEELFGLILDFCFRINLLILWELPTCLYILIRLQSITFQMESTFLLSSVNQDQSHFAIGMKICTHTCIHLCGHMYKYICRCIFLFFLWLLGFVSSLHRWHLAQQYYFPFSIRRTHVFAFNSSLQKVITGISIVCISDRLGKYDTCLTTFDTEEKKPASIPAFCSGMPSCLLVCKSYFPVYVSHRLVSSHRPHAEVKVDRGCPPAVIHRCSLLLPSFQEDQPMYSHPHSAEKLQNSKITRIKQCIHCFQQPDSGAKWSRRDHNNHAHVSGFIP